jgi:uncharacterized protein (DUF2225 family)
MLDMYPLIFQVVVTVSGLYVALDHRFDELKTRITVLEATLKAKNVIAYTTILEIKK